MHKSRLKYSRLGFKNMDKHKMTKFSMWQGSKKAFLFHNSASIVALQYLEM